MILFLTYGVAAICFWLAGDLVPAAILTGAQVWLLAADMLDAARERREEAEDVQR